MFYGAKNEECVLRCLGGMLCWHVDEVRIFCRPILSQGSQQKQKTDQFDCSLPFLEHLDHSRHRPLELMFFYTLLWLSAIGANCKSDSTVKGVLSSADSFEKHPSAWMQMTQILTAGLLPLALTLSPWTHEDGTPQQMFKPPPAFLSVGGLSAVIRFSLTAIRRNSTGAEVKLYAFKSCL